MADARGGEAARAWGSRQKKKNKKNRRKQQRGRSIAGVRGTTPTWLAMVHGACACVRATFRAAASKRRQTCVWVTAVKVAVSPWRADDLRVEPGPEARTRRRTHAGNAASPYGGAHGAHALFRH